MRRARSAEKFVHVFALNLLTPTANYVHEIIGCH